MRQRPRCGIQHATCTATYTVAMEAAQLARNRPCFSASVHRVEHPQWQRNYVRYSPRRTLQYPRPSTLAGGLAWLPRRTKMHSAGALEAQPAHSRAQPHRTNKTISKACGTGPHGADALRHADDRQQQLAVQRVREPRLLHLQPSGGKPPRRTLAQAEPAIPLIPLRPSLQSRSSHLGRACNPAHPTTNTVACPTPSLA